MCVCVVRWSPSQDCRPHQDEEFGMFLAIDEITPFPRITSAAPAMNKLGLGYIPPREFVLRHTEEKGLYKVDYKQVYRTHHRMH